MIILPIRNNLDFKSVLRDYNAAFHTSNIICALKETSSKYTQVDSRKRAEEFVRVGLVVSKKIDKRAVGRNKIKRRLREAFKEALDANLDLQKKLNHIDCVIVARKFITNAEFSTIVNDVLNCLKGNAKSGVPISKKKK